MPKTKELSDKEIEKKTSEVLQWPIGNRTNLVVVLSKSIVAETEQKRVDYENANSALKTIETNGK